MNERNRWTRMVGLAVICGAGLILTGQAAGQTAARAPARDAAGALAPYVLDVAPAVELRLDGSTSGVADGRPITALLGPGAGFAPSVEGQGVTPGDAGPAVTVPVPAALWGQQGTLAFRFKTSRTLRGAAGERGRMVLLRCPVFTLSLVERPDAIRLVADLAHDGSMKDEQTLNRFALGKIDWSRLDAGKWYHLAISWDARFPENRLEGYLNGAAQQEMRPGRAWWYPWRLPKDREGPLELGGVLGDGDRRARISIDSVQLYPKFMYEEDVARTLGGRPNFALAGEGRWDLQGKLDLAPYRLSLIYETDFDEPLKVVDEADLFDGDRRVRTPKGKDWVFESNGASRVWTEDGLCLVLTNRSHSVLWNTRVVPSSFLLEFGMRPKDSSHGLAIVFFAARPTEGDGSIFDPGLPRRAGRFRNYTHGKIKAFHCSYWATSQQSILRRSTNLRKNPDFHMPAVGIDRIGGAGSGPHVVRVLKVAHRVQIETRGRRALEFADDGRTYGPLLGDGHIGLRQMAHSRQVSYTHFRVWKVEPRDANVP